MKQSTTHEEGSSFLLSKINNEETTTSPEHDHASIIIPKVKLVEDPALHFHLSTKNRRRSSRTISINKNINNNCRGTRSSKNMSRNMLTSESSHSDSDSEAISSAQSVRFVADCSGCGKTHSFRGKKYFQHTVRSIYCGQYKENVRPSEKESRETIEDSVMSSTVNSKTEKINSLESCSLLDSDYSGCWFTRSQP